MKFKTLLENVLKPISYSKIKWNTLLDRDYTIVYNDSNNHNLLDRIKDRTDLLPYEVRNKVEKAIKYIIKKDKKDFFKQKTMVSFTMKKSKFKVMILFNPKDNYIRVSSILNMNMVVRGAIKWDLNEDTILIEKVWNYE